MEHFRNTEKQISFIIESLNTILFKLQTRFKIGYGASNSCGI